MSIKHWPAGERPREKLLRHGVQSLSEAELLAICFGSGVPGEDAVGFARSLLRHFGGLRPLLNAEQRELCQTPGLGEARYAKLQVIKEIGRRHLLEKLQRGAALTDPDLTRRYVRACLRDRQREVFLCIFLDNKHAVLQAEEMFLGTLNTTCVYPREVVRACMRCNAAAVIFAHNHPSGVAEPSVADRKMTRKLQDALELVDVRVLDHLVVGDGREISFAEEGLL